MPAQEDTWFQFQDEYRDKELVTHDGDLDVTLVFVSFV